MKITEQCVVALTWTLKDTLGEDKIHVITAYVYRLSRADDTK